METVALVLQIYGGNCSPGATDLLWKLLPWCYRPMMETVALVLQIYGGNRCPDGIDL